MELCSELPEPESLKCPRCDSRETKFCYYNNYSTTQPRHFCRNCKRYWTAGGSLRNVPVGGGLRKNKKSKLSKHLKEMLSGSSDEIFSPGNPTPLLLASPSSSADGVVDETLSNPAIPLCVYRPCYESAAESLPTGDCTPSLGPMNSRNFAHQSGACGHVLLTDGHQQHAHDAFHGIHQPQFGFGCVDQGQFNSGKISSEPSHASHKATELTAALYPRYSVLQQQAHGVPTGLRQNESRYFNKQGNLQYSAEENGFSHINRNVSSAEDEDEGLGNVINVGYPYDWEQVSEVLCVGTPDFFQIPTF